MFHHLLESGPRARCRSSWTIVSGSAHAAAIAVAVALTMPNASPTVERVSLPELVFKVPVSPPTPPAPIAQPSPPDGVRWPTPLDIRITIPFVPAVRLQVDRGFEPPIGETFGSALSDRPAAGPIPRDQVHSIQHVDREVVPRHNNARPAYPDALRSALVEGNVLVQFVVDTTGRVEPRSIAIVRATHPGFAEAVRRWLPHTRYSPAEARGGRVRQLVQQVVGFTLQ
jgi:protein TonB